MPTLALDTATFVATAAVTRGTEVLAEITWGLKKSHSERILPAVDLVLREAGLSMADIQRIAVSGGPGSFTGLRIGMSLAKGLAEGQGIPVVTVSTLTVLAQQAALHKGIIIPLLSAQRGQFYGSLFRSSGSSLTQIHTDAVISPEELDDWISENGEEVLLTGEAAPEVVGRFGVQIAPLFLRTPRAGVMGILSSHYPSRTSDQVAPNYIRPSSAQPKKGSDV